MTMPEQTQDRIEEVRLVTTEKVVNTPEYIAARKGAVTPAMAQESLDRIEAKLDKFLGQ